VPAHFIFAYRDTAVVTRSPSVRLPARKLRDVLAAAARTRLALDLIRGWQ
jgi:hypothetical protein